MYVESIKQHEHECVNFASKTTQTFFTETCYVKQKPGNAEKGIKWVFLFRCIHEFMDVYSEVQRPDQSELINTPFGGRYCGPIPPRRRISLFRTIALAFYTDKNITTPDLFSGRYTFINDCEFHFFFSGQVREETLPRIAWPAPSKAPSSKFTAILRPTT